MSKKQTFINEINKILRENDVKLSPDAEDYFIKMREDKEKNGKEITDNGIKNVKWMSENKDAHSNLFSAKTIADGIFSSSRSVSGAMRKLVTDGYVEKHEGEPKMYSITEKGLDIAKNL